MHLKVLFIMFLCLFGASVICNAAMMMQDVQNKPMVYGRSSPVQMGHLILNGTDPDGDPLIPDGPWP